MMLTVKEEGIRWKGEEILSSFFYLRPSAFVLQPNSYNLLPVTEVLDGC